LALRRTLAKIASKKKEGIEVPDCNVRHVKSLASGSA